MSSFLSSARSLFGLAALMALAAATGCRQQDDIAVHVVPGWKSGLPEIVAMPGPRVGIPDRRMVVAIANLPSATWFFKLDDAAATVAAAEDEWTRFLAGVSFAESGDPVWETPAGWQVAPASPNRFATLSIPVEGGGQLELAVSSLGPGQDLAMNVNRWLGQLGLPPVGPDRIPSLVRPFDYQNGQFLVFDQRTASVAATAGTPGGEGASAPSGADGETAEPPFTYQAPEGWTLLPQSMFTVLKFSRESEEGKLTVSISQLPAAANPWETSVGSWLAEAGLESPSLDEWLARTEKMEIDGLEASRIQIVGDAASNARGIDAVRLERGPQAWYFKMAGDRELVQRSAEQLTQFLSSIRFE